AAVYDAPPTRRGPQANVRHSREPSSAAESKECARLDFASRTQIAAVPFAINIYAQVSDGFVLYRRAHAKFCVSFGLAVLARSRRSSRSSQLRSHRISANCLPYLRRCCAAALATAQRD